MLKILKKEGFASLIEVVITSAIFIAAGFGLFTTLSMLRPHTTVSTNKLRAAYIGKSIIEELRTAVDATTWDDPNSNLATGIMFERDIDGFHVNYYLSPDPLLNIRQLYMNISYTD